MTDQEAMDLGKRAVACPGWRWLPGMLIRYGSRGLPIDVCRIGGDDGQGRQRPTMGSEWWPDFRDAATVGCLVALVREAHGDPHWTTYTVYSPSADVYRWAAHGRGGGTLTSHAADRGMAHVYEVGALVAALEGA